MLERQRRLPILPRRRPSHTSPSQRRPRHPIRHTNFHRLPHQRNLRSRELKEVHRVESVVGPENVVGVGDFRLAAADGGVLVVEEETPELGGGLGGGGDAGYEEVLEGCESERDRRGPGSSCDVHRTLCQRS